MEVRAGDERRQAGSCADQRGSQLPLVLICRVPKDSKARRTRRSTKDLNSDCLRETSCPSCFLPYSFNSTCSTSTIELPRNLSPKRRNFSTESVTKNLRRGLTVP